MASPLIVRPATRLNERVEFTATPSLTIQDGLLTIGDAQSSKTTPFPPPPPHTNHPPASTRAYTPLKILHSSAFSTVLLADYHSFLPPSTPIPEMQLGAGARPAWRDKTLVVVKEIKRKWEGGWEEYTPCAPPHPNVVPLLDAFLALTPSQSLHLITAPLEGTLHHLLKARRARPLAARLLASLFHQLAAALSHIHAHGVMHRDVKPENVLLTTTGLFSYAPFSVSPSPPGPGAGAGAGGTEKDVVAVLKLGDFGLAREEASAAPYTEYVNTRWYRAPEVLLFAPRYTKAVDMWAFAVVMAEVVNLRPLFEGRDTVDQVGRVVDVLGHPGERWTPPKDLATLFDAAVPPSLVDCLRGLLKWDPERRLTAGACLGHVYLEEMGREWYFR
ncbi:kinase-like domain-containing protein [Crassisporium funariophilum]|nr:kinase-like domain-containing protein [Crassisporium funariophilum]